MRGDIVEANRFALLHFSDVGTLSHEGRKDKKKTIIETFFLLASSAFPFLHKHTHSTQFLVLNYLDLIVW